MAHNIKATATQRGVVRSGATAGDDPILAGMAIQLPSAVAITGGSVVGITDLALADGGTGASTAADARTNLGLGSMATQAASSVAITGGSVTGITDIAVADGGTGASTAADARTNLGLGSIATQAASAVAITGGTVTGITDLAIADGGTGASSAADARTNLGLGTMATQNASSVAITGGSITGLGTPVAASDAVTKAYADAIVSGLSDFKDSVAVATTANITLSGEQTIDGVTTAGSRVLVKNQTSAPANGIYVSAAGAWTRATDMDATNEVSKGTYVYVEGGTLQGRTAWVVTASPAVLGTNDMTWVQFSGINDTIAGAGLTQSSGIMAVGAGNGISVAADSVAVIYASPSASVDAGDAASEGSANSAARSDHQHAVTTGAAVGLTPDSANGEGSGAALARANHTHAIASAAPAASGSLAAASALGSAASFAKSDHVHSTVPASDGVDLGSGSPGGNRWKLNAIAVNNGGACYDYGVSRITATGTTAMGTDSHIVLADAAGSVTVELPAAAITQNGRTFRIKQLQAQTCTIQRPSGDTGNVGLIDGAASYLLDIQYGSVDLVCYNAGSEYRWAVIG